MVIAKFEQVDVPKIVVEKDAGTSMDVSANSEILWQRISAIDLSPLKRKLANKEHGEGWTEERCDYVEGEYKRFLILNSLYKQKLIVPSLDVDTMWHYHILDTRKYSADCEASLGFFLHHYPYLGIRYDGDADNLVYAYKETELLYERHFGSLGLEGHSSEMSSCSGGYPPPGPPPPPPPSCAGSYPPPPPPWTPPTINSNCSN